MENPLTCHLEDPFSDFSLVSLCPFTSKQHDLDPSPNLRNVESLEAVGALLESMALKNPNKLLEKAMSVEDDIRGEDTLGDLHGVNRENLQGRRPALGRKKARFSLKPSSSQSECLVPSVDINKFSDPEEFFLALEKQENAKNEMRRQGGKALADLDQNVPYVERRRRPGLSRKSASYKHRFTVAPSDDNTFLSSQETLSQDLCSPNPSNHFLQTENTDTIASSLTRELSGPIVAGKESAIDVFDVLQSGQDIDDDSDDIIGMLQDRFKPIEINKSCLPDMDSVLQSEFKTVEESLWSQDKMSDLHDVVSAIGKETTIGGNNVERSSDYSSTSPKPPKSLYSSISSLRARLFQHRKEKGQFSAVDIYSALPGKAAFCKDTHDLAAQDIEYSVEDSMKTPNVCSSNTMHIEPGDASGDNDTGETNPNSPVHESECYLVSKDTQGLAALDIESSAKYSVKMPNTSSTNGIHIESGDAAGDNDMRETNPSSPVHENECDLFGKDTQALAAAKFTSSEKRIKGDSDLLGVPSDFTEHMESDVDIVKYDERDVNPQSPLLQKESDTAYTMGTFKERSATLGVFSDGVVEFDHGIGGGQSPKPAEDENENNVLYSKVTHDMGAESCTSSEQIPKDNSTISSFGLNTALHVETDHEFRANDMQGRVLEDNPSNVFDDVVDPASEHIQPDERVVAEEIQDCNMENSNHNAEQSTANALEDLEKDKSSSDRDGVPTMGAIGDHDHNRPSTSQNQPLKKSRKAFSKTAQLHPPPPETRAAVARKRSRECIEFSKRKSLAGCGTHWETGVRRSTRIRTRPLEYWKGERQLYGRIHDSVISVIGIKYFSPTKETGVAGLKVNSYVSDEYAELVEQAALH